MAIKLADTLAPMAEFPAVMGEHVNLVKNDDTEKSLQKMYEDGELGGGGGDSSFKGTRDEWNKLSDEEKAKYDGQQILFTDDVLEGETNIGTYSKKEMRIGTWINGDSIYRRVLTDLNVIPKSASWVDTGINVSFAKRLIDVRCFRESGGSMGYMLLSRINDGTKTLGIYSGSTYNIPVDTMVIEYTK